MKTITSNHAFQSKLWIALLVSVVALSACSNEVEETPDSTMDTTEATAVGTEPTDTEVGTDTTTGETTTDMGMANTDSTMDPAGTATTDTMTDSTITDEMTDGSVISDTTMVDENNTSFNQDPVESTQ
ncbi:hypothetical protein [Psychrobacter vallis]|uniref:hypothetical protein n=1 Tax=Psychrobacter vallis TaxID=248451 RepID=UPI001919CF54|nr:hypothetical protein [Psychrobacter vallis]